MCCYHGGEILEFGVASSLMGFLFPLDYLIESCAPEIVQKDAASRGAKISLINLELMKTSYTKIF